MIPAAPGPEEARAQVKAQHEQQKAQILAEQQALLEKLLAARGPGGPMPVRK